MSNHNDLTTRLAQFLASDNWGEGGGAPGLSAYEVALANGFVGSESAWLASLIGPQGTSGSQGIQGPQGNPGTNGAQGSPGPPGDPGADGLSAYEVAVVNGFSGSEAQWLASLVGPQGSQGQQGIQGPEGPAGSVSAAWPVGSVFTSVVSTNPATLLGFGTWVAFAAGRVLVGIDAGDPDFDTARETRGSKTHTLTESEIPSHTHTQNAHGHNVTDTGHTHLTQRYPTATGSSSGFTIDTSMSGTLADNTLPTKTATAGVTVQNATAVNQNTGGGAAHNNVQPSIVVYFWERTA